MGQPSLAPAWPTARAIPSDQTFAGLTIGICLHIEPKTAVLCGVFQAGGADVVITGSPGIRRMTLPTRFDRQALLY